MVQIITSDEILEQPKTLRIKFFKKGSLQFISHLDLVRTMTRVLLRARLPLWYSEGFNPRPRLIFATPMSVGAESECELLDIRINKEVNPSAVMDALNRNLPPEMQATEVYYPETKLSELSFSSYIININTEGADASMAERCHTLLNTAPITVVKRSKSGDKPVDISPMVDCASATLDGGTIRINCVLNSASDNFLNPEYLVTYLKEKMGVISGNPMEESYEIIRTGVYFSDKREFR